MLIEGGLAGVAAGALASAVSAAETVPPRMEIGRCADCGYWMKFGATSIREEVRGLGRCKHPKLSFYKWGEEASNDILSGGESLYSPEEPDTGPDFGCIHFERKP